MRPQVLQVLKGCGEVEGERCPEGWQMSPSWMTTRLRSGAAARLEFSRMELYLPVELHSAARDKWQDADLQREILCVQGCCVRKKLWIK
jgi:hypothetical protein